MLEDRRDPGLGAVAQDVDVELDCILEVAVDEARAVHVELACMARDVDPAPADHVVRSHEHRVAELVGRNPRFFCIGGCAPGWRVQAQLVE